MQFVCPCCRAVRRKHTKVLVVVIRSIHSRFDIAYIITINGYVGFLRQ